MATAYDLYADPAIEKSRVRRGCADDADIAQEEPSNRFEIEPCVRCFQLKIRRLPVSIAARDITLRCDTCGHEQKAQLNATEVSFINEMLRLRRGR